MTTDVYRYINIGVPRGTRLHHLVRVDDGWLVFTALGKQPTNDPRTWRGTHLHLHDDGSITRVSTYDDRPDEVFVVKGADND